jgi:hypothetical protein
VLLPGSVAVAVTCEPELRVVLNMAVKAALPIASVTTGLNPRKLSPSPYLDGSQLRLEKNSSRKAVLGVLLSVPWMVVTPATLVAERSIG